MRFFEKLVVAYFFWATLYMRYMRKKATYLKIMKP